MSSFRNNGLLLGLVILVGFASPAFAFGAGNIASISKVEGQNWRHGDIEDALLTLTFARALGGKKFNKMNVSRTYFGNWLRDYSQAVDVGTVKSVSAEAIRLLLCVLGFLTFGYGSGEFEVTAERLGTYRPEEHIDNPKDYAENVDARQYDRRLRGPVDERRELSIDPETGMKNYIANERAGIMTSAKLVRHLFSGFIEHSRRYGRSGNKADKYEALRLMGTGLHCLEDFFAHSNYCELALIELGERDVFPLVGRNTQIQLQGARHPVYPIVTGTFGGVDFLHSVTGEVSDKLTQNEIDELEGTLQQSGQADTSLLRSLLDKIPDGIFGNKNQSGKIDELQENAANAQMQNTSISPRDPEEFTIYVQNIFKQVMPAIEFHDDIMKGIASAVEKIPVLPKLIEQLEDQLSIFIFSLIAPFVVPLINQIRNELKTGSDEIIGSSEREQHNVFYDESASDPTHSMLAKDHFSNILNEIAGRCAASVVTWAVPQLMEAVDNEDINVDSLLDGIIGGVMHHPAQRDMGHGKVREGRQRIFQNVEEWWNDLGRQGQDEYRRKLGREGVQNGENHKEGVQDTGHGHGCAGKLKMRKLYGEPETMEDKIAGAAAGAIFSGATSAISGLVEGGNGSSQSHGHGGGGGGEGGLPGVLGSVASSLLGGGGGGGGGLGDALGSILGDGNSRRETSSRREDDGSYTRTERQYGHAGGHYAQAEYSETQRPDGSRQSEYSRYDQQERNSGQVQGYGYQERTETHTSYGHQQQHTERQEYRGSSGGDYGRRSDDDDGEGRRHHGHGGGHHQRRDSDDERREESSYGGGYQQQGGYGGGGGGGGYQQQESYGGGYQRQEGGYGGSSGYERRNESSYGGGGYGGGSYERREEGRYGGSADEYSRQSEGGYGGGDYERREERRYGGETDEYSRQSEGSYGGGGSGGGGYERRDERRW